MKGYILFYNSKGKNTVRLNHKLMGRIISIPDKGGSGKKHYYNKGELDQMPHKRLASGCYFSKGDVNIDSSNLKKVKADIQLQEKDLITARGHWVSHAKKKKLSVRNLGRG